MKPDYKNWMPKGMIYSFLFAALGCGIAAVWLLCCSSSVCGTVSATSGQHMDKPCCSWKS